LHFSSTHSTPLSTSSPEQVSDHATTPLKSILLCGASVRSLAESCITAGLRPLCIDFFADHDLKRSLQQGRGRFVARLNSFEDLPQALRRIRRSVPLVWAGGLENYSDVLRTLAEDRIVIGAAPEAVEAVRNPLNLANWVCRSDMQVPQILLGALPDAGQRWLQKSIRSSGGLGVHWMTRGLPTIGRADDRGGSQRSEDPQELPHGSNYFQEFIDGVPLSATFVSGPDGVRSIGVSLQLVGWPSLGASDFLFCGNIGPICPPAWMSRRLLATAIPVANRSGLRGVFGLDFILKQGVLWLLEVNPRLTASHVIYDQVATNELQKPLFVEHLHAFGFSSSTNLSESSRTLSRKALALGNSPTEPAASALPLTKDGRQRSRDLGRVMLRMILWATEEFMAPDYHAPGDMARFLGLKPETVRLGDLPAAGSSVSKRSPLCSVEMEVADLCAIPNALVASVDRTGAEPKYCWDSTAAAIRDLLRLYELHLLATPGC
jgi:predicted ATP-grasp superfamily ATP-dependent carboligase